MAVPGMELIFRTKHSFVPISHVWVFYVDNNLWILCQCLEVTGFTEITVFVFFVDFNIASLVYFIMI